MASHTTTTSTVYEVEISVATLSTELIGVTPLILLNVKLPTYTNCPVCACEAWCSNGVQPSVCCSVLSVVRRKKQLSVYLTEVKGTSFSCYFGYFLCFITIHEHCLHLFMMSTMLQITW